MSLVAGIGSSCFLRLHLSQLMGDQIRVCNDLCAFLVGKALTVVIAGIDLANPITGDTVGIICSRYGIHISQGVPCLHGNLLSRQGQAGTEIQCAGIGFAAILAGIVSNAAILCAGRSLCLHRLQLMVAGLGIDDAVLDQISAGFITEVPVAVLAVPMRFQNTVFCAGRSLYCHLDNMVATELQVFLLSQFMFSFLILEVGMTDGAAIIGLAGANRNQILQGMLTAGLNA